MENSVSTLVAPLRTSIFCTPSTRAEAVAIGPSMSATAIVLMAFPSRSETSEALWSARISPVCPSSAEITARVVA